MSGILAKTLAALDHAAVRYAAVRDGEELAAGAEPREVDLLVDPGDLVQLEAVIGPLGFVRVPAWGHEPHRFYVAYDSASCRWLKLDVVTQICYGRPCHAWRVPWERQCLERRVRRGTIWVLDPHDEVLTLLLHCLLDKSEIGPARRARLQELIRADLDQAGLSQRWQTVWPGGPSWNRIASAIEHGEWDWLQNRVASLSRALRRRSWGYFCWRNVRDRGLRKLHQAYRFLRPPAPAVAVVAPDGAGKSTLIATIEQSFGLQVRSIHMGLYRQGQRRAWWRRVPGLGILGNLCTQWARLLQARCHRARGRLVVFDRYCFDALLPTGKALGGLQRWRRQLLARSCPGPDLVVMLDAPGEVLFARKGEHDVAHLERQRQGYLSLGQRLPNMIVVDASRDAESVHKVVTGLIWQRLAERLRRRPVA
jgi:thymidylate kinase